MGQPANPTATPWATYPWDPGGHWPWETPPAQAATSAAPPDTSARQKIIDAYAADHGGYTEGSASTVYDKPTAAQVAAAKSDEDKQKLKNSLDSGFDLYTFGDGTSVELSQNGQQRNLKLAAAAQQKLNQPQAVTANTTDPKLVTRNPDGTYSTADNPNYKPPAPTQIQSNTTDQFITMRDPNNPNNVVTVKNPNYVPPTGKTVSTNTTDQNIVTQNPDGTYTTTPNPNYVPPKGTSVATNTTDQYIVTRNPDDTMKSEPNPNYKPPTATQISSNTTDQFITMKSPDGQITTVKNPNYVAPTGTTLPTGTNDQFITTKNPDGTFSTVPNPNYVPPKPTQLQTSATTPFISTMDAQGNVTNIPNPSYTPTDPGRMTVQLKQQADQQWQALQQQVALGKMTSDQAASQFSKYWDTNIEPIKADIAQAQAKAQSAIDYQQAQTGYQQGLTSMLPADLAEKASNDAQSRAISMLPYLVNSSAATTPGVTPGGGGRGFPSVNAQQIMQNATFSVPNLQEIGRQGAAAALAHISPTAAMHAQMPGPLGQPQVSGLDLNSYLAGAGATTVANPAAAAAAPAGAGAQIPQNPVYLGLAQSGNAPQNYGPLTANPTDWWGNYQPAS